MKKFLPKLLMYSAAVIAVSVAILSFFGSYYWHNRVPVIKQELLSKRSGSISLVLGSSHTFYGINSDLVADNCYNMASTSQTLYEDYLVLKSVSENSNIDFVLLPISFFSNNFFLHNVVLDGEYMRIFDYEKVYGAGYPATPRYLKARFILYTEMAKAMLARNKEKNSFDPHGNLAGKCDNKPHDISDSVGAFDRHNVYAGFDTRNVYLDSIINICSRKHIKLNIVVMPFTSGYNNQLAAKGQGFESYLSALRTIPLPNYKFLDCRHFFTTDEPVYFRDADHLSICGRDSLSRYLSLNILK